MNKSHIRINYANTANKNKRITLPPPPKKKGNPCTLTGIFSSSPKERKNQKQRTQRPFKKNCTALHLVSQGRDVTSGPATPSSSLPFNPLLAPLPP